MQSVLTRDWRIIQSSHQKPPLVSFRAQNRSPTHTTPKAQVIEVEARNRGTFVSLRSNPGGGSGSEVIGSGIQTRRKWFVATE